MIKNGCHPGRARSAKIRDRRLSAAFQIGPGSAPGFARLVRDGKLFGAYPYAIVLP